MEPGAVKMPWGGVRLEAPGLGLSECLDCRIQLAEKFVKAVSKPSRPDMNPIR